MMEYTDNVVWHKKEKGPCFLLELSQSNNKRRFRIVQLNQGDVGKDFEININENEIFKYGYNQQ